MRNICKKENAPYPKVEFNGNYFYITFTPSKEYLKMAKKEKIIELSRLNDRQIKGLEFLKKEGRITTKEYIKVTGAIRRTAIRDLNDMVNKKILKIAGGQVGKQRYYVLL